VSSDLELTGLDGANPLAFLAAVGTLRVVEMLYPAACRMGWRNSGKWLPVLELPDAVNREDLVTRLHGLLNRKADPTAAGEATKLQKACETLNRQLKEADSRVKKRRLRGAERDAAIKEEVEPIREQAEAARDKWLNALARAMPAPFLALGKTLSVSQEEFARFTQGVAHRLRGAKVEEVLRQRGREDADFAAAFGCEARLTRQGKIVATEFQFITGSGQQFFLETLRILMEEITPEKLHRSLFGPWTYADAKRSFRWEPGEDRRYAYGWSDPSGDEVKTEHGANLLAAMALPLFPTTPTTRRLATTGFSSGGDVPAFTWPIWEPAISVDVVRSLLAQAELAEEHPNRNRLRRMGVAEVFRSNKIEVGRPPLSKLNLTPSVAV
jgi:hypothetical protein